MRDEGFFRWRQFARCCAVGILGLLQFAICNFCFAQCGPAGCPAPQYAAAGANSISVPAEVCAAIVQVRVDDGAATSVGSGTYVEPGLIVTNWHVVRDRASDTVILTWLDQGSTRGKVLGADELSDLAVIEPDAPAGVTPVRLREVRPTIGESLSVAGYAGGRFPLCGMSARMVSQTRDPRSPTWNFIALSAASVPGMSGGPVLDGGFSLAGVLWGTDGERTIGASCVEVCGLFDRICPGRRQAWSRRQSSPQAPAAASRRPVTNRPPAVVPGSQVPVSQTGDLSKYALKSELAKLQDQFSALESDLNALDGKQKTLGGQLLSDLQTKIDAGIDDQLGAKLPPALAPLGELVKTELGKIKRDVAALNTGLPGRIEKIVEPLVADAIGAQAAALPKLGASALATSLGLPIGGGLAAGLGLIGWLLRAKKKTEAGGSIVTSGGQTSPSGGTIGPTPPGQPAVPIATAAPTQTPVFVQSEVESPAAIALAKALDTFGAQTPQNARWVNLVYSLRNQLLNTTS